MCVCVTVPVGKVTLGIEKLKVYVECAIYVFVKKKENDNDRLNLVKTWKKEFGKKGEIGMF